MRGSENRVVRPCRNLVRCKRSKKGGWGGKKEKRFQRSASVFVLHPSATTNLVSGVRPHWELFLCVESLLWYQLITHIVFGQTLVQRRTYTYGMSNVNQLIISSTEIVSGSS